MIKEWTDLTSTAFRVVLGIMRKTTFTLLVSQHCKAASHPGLYIAGIPASGKTTLAHLLTEHIRDKALQPTSAVHFTTMLY